MKNVISKLLIVVLFLLMQLFVTLTYAQNPCIVAWYHFDGNTLDCSGNSHHATNYGATPTQDRHGNPNAAMHFDGIANYVSCPDDYDFQQRTICLWFKPETFPTSGGVIYTVDHGSLQYGLTKLMVGQELGINRIAFGVASNIYYYENATTGTWYHLALSIDGTYIRFYLNGVQVDSMLNDDLAHSSSGASVARIGTNRIDERYFKGDIDEVLVYDCALTDEEIFGVYLSVPENNETDEGFSIFPIPANEEITLKIDNIKNPNDIYDVSIYNSVGLLVEQFNNILTNNIKLNISNLSKGVYYFKVIGRKATYISRFIKL